VTDPLPPSIQPDSGGPPEAAVTVGAHAVAKFADRHHIPLAPALREDLARAVLTEAWPTSQLRTAWVLRQVRPRLAERPHVQAPPAQVHTARAAALPTRDNGSRYGPRRLIGRAC
jgi:hypothetical protein